MPRRRRCRRHTFVDAQDLTGRADMFVCDRCGAHGGHPATVYARARVRTARGRRVVLTLRSSDDVATIVRLLGARGARAPVTLYADMEAW